MRKISARGMQRNNRKQPDETTRRTLPARLDATTFEPIYHTLTGLKFPVDVAQVLELRYVVNHALDDFPEPAETRDYRDFCETLTTIVDAVGIANKRHRERLLRILVMVRNLHYTYSVNTRDAENKLRAHMARNRKARGNATRYGLFFTCAAIIAGFGWTAIGESTWWIQLLAGTCLYFAWDYLHALPLLDREMKSIEQKMTNLMRHRVRSIEWYKLTRQLAMVLGHLRDGAIEAFHVYTDINSPDHPRLPH